VYGGAKFGEMSTFCKFSTIFENFRKTPVFFGFFLNFRGKHWLKMTKKRRFFRKFFEIFDIFRNSQVQHFDQIFTIYIRFRSETPVCTRVQNSAKCRHFANFRHFCKFSKKGRHTPVFLVFALNSGGKHSFFVTPKPVFFRKIYKMSTFFEISGPRGNSEINSTFY